MLLFVVRVWGEQYIVEIVLNNTLFVLRNWGRKCIERLKLNVTVSCGVLGRAIYSGTYAECHSICCEKLGRAI